MPAQAEKKLVQDLLNSPRLSLYASQIQAVLDDEARRRQAFYAEISEADKAEFINGEVIYHSPVKLRHNIAVKYLLVLLDAYVRVTDSGLVGFEKLLISLTRNDYEPDICYFGKEKARRFRPDQMRFPAPDFVAEVLSASTAQYDRGVKFEDYAAHGVAEYWIVDPDAETIEQYCLQGDVYELAIKAQTGELKSCAISGFVIPVRAVFDERENQAALRGVMRRD
ncbi:MAG: Uma2 family endonuclease [Chloroflexi bacterium]|nr:Uma2 family endonuclease [Chloroflexota bacterium]